MKAKAVAEELWKLLDEIDTQDDACREHDDVFRERVREILKERCRYIWSDGQRLIWRKQPL